MRRTSLIVTGLLLMILVCFILFHKEGSNRSDEDMKSNETYQLSMPLDTIRSKTLFAFMFQF